MKERGSEAIMENITDEGKRDDDRADYSGMTAKRHRQVRHKQGGRENEREKRSEQGKEPGG